MEYLQSIATGQMAKIYGSEYQLNLKERDFSLVFNLYRILQNNYYYNNNSLIFCLKCCHIIAKHFKNMRKKKIHRVITSSSGISDLVL